MKKVPFLFVLACLFTLVLHAQHRPFVVEGKRWVVEYNEYQLGWIHNYQGKSYVTSPMTYYIEGDTTINEKSYKKVYQKCTLETGRDTTDYYSAIREDADGEADARDALQHQRMGGHLHHNVGAARVQHLAEELVQLIALRRCTLRRELLRADHIAVGSDQADLCPCLRLQQMLDQIGRRCFAVGPRDADHRHLPCRIAEQIARGERERIARILDQYVRDFNFRRVLAQNGDCALLNGGGDEPMSVADRTDDRSKEIAGAGAAGIIADPADLGIGIRRHAFHRNVLQNVLQKQGNALLSVSVNGSVPSVCAGVRIGQRDAHDRAVRHGRFIIMSYRSS